MSPLAKGQSAQVCNDLGHKHTAVSPSSSETFADQDLARVRAAWSTLSGPIKAAILALADAAGATTKNSTAHTPRPPVSRSGAGDGQNYPDDEETS